MNSFDDLRPYSDAEIPTAMQRIAAWDLFPQAIRFIYPNADIAQIKEKTLDIKSVYQFQSTLMSDAIHRIIQTSTPSYCNYFSLSIEATPRISSSETTF